MDISEIIINGPDYIVLRRSQQFPNIERGQDIDLLVKSIDDWVFYLKVSLRQFGGQCVNYPLNDNHHQLDFYLDGFHHKYDLFTFYVSHEFTNDLWNDRRVIERKYYVPSIRHERIAKCYEYMTYGKSKYAEYEQFKDQLHDYTL